MAVPPLFAEWSERKTAAFSPALSGQTAEEERQGVFTELSRKALLCGASEFEALREVCAATFECVTAVRYSQVFLSKAATASKAEELDMRASVGAPREVSLRWFREPASLAGLSVLRFRVSSPALSAAASRIRSDAARVWQCICTPAILGVLQALGFERTGCVHTEALVWQTKNFTSSQTTLSVQRHFRDEGLTLPVAASRDCWLLELSARCLGEDALSGADSAMDAVAAALKHVVTLRKVNHLHLAEEEAAAAAEASHRLSRADGVVS